MPPDGDGVYYFSTYLLGDDGEWGRFDMRLNDEVICTAFSDHNNGGFTLQDHAVLLWMLSLVMYMSQCITGQERLIRSHSSARFCFELS